MLILNDGEMYIIFSTIIKFFLILWEVLTFTFQEVLLVIHFDYIGLQ